MTILTVGATMLSVIVGCGDARAACSIYGSCATPYETTEEGPFAGMYLRGSVGYGLGSTPDVSVEGWSIDGPTRNGSLSTSFAAGGWITPDWRAEVSVSPIFGSRIEYDAPTALVSGSTYSAGVRNTSTIVPVMFDVYRDFDTKTAFRPYLGAGAGVALVWSDLTAHFSDGTTNLEYKVASSFNASFAASAMAGIGVDLSKNLTLDIGYKYLYVDRIQAKKDVSGYALTALSKQNSFNQFLVGARYRFD